MCLRTTDDRNFHDPYAIFRKRIILSTESDPLTFSARKVQIYYQNRFAIASQSMKICLSNERSSIFPVSGRFFLVKTSFAGTPGEAEYYYIENVVFSTRSVSLTTYSGSFLLNVHSSQQNVQSSSPHQIHQTQALVPVPSSANRDAPLWCRPVLGSPVEMQHTNCT